MIGKWYFYFLCIIIMRKGKHLCRVIFTDYKEKTNKQTKKKTIFFENLKKTACLLLVFRRLLHVHPQHERPIERGKLFSLTEMSLIC